MPERDVRFERAKLRKARKYDISQHSFSPNQLPIPYNLPAAFISWLIPFHTITIQPTSQQHFWLIPYRCQHSRWVPEFGKYIAVPLPFEFILLRLPASPRAADSSSWPVSASIGTNTDAYYHPCFDRLWICMTSLR